jgi:DNA helicase-2/ATP-dependent DNA helicase PcrA
MFKPRPRQQEVLDYASGRMGVSAVPGSGKTSTLSCLAAQLVASGVLAEDQEVLVVTLVNSAVDNFANQVAGYVKERGLLPRMGYRVRTLHGLAHDIVQERPDLAGLSDDFKIADERAADRIRQDAVQAWLRGHPDTVGDFLSYDLSEKEREDARRKQWSWPRLASDIALSLIRHAKDRQVTPDDLRTMLEETPLPRPLVEMGGAIYADYQRGLRGLEAVDFDDLMWHALRTLQHNPDYLERLRHRWPFILEDEAQDSSALQERILRLLVGPDGNWVRVGDPNQAIYETFTTASPHFLRDFLQEEGVVARQLPNSGRSTQSIINLANYLIDWTRQDHPVAEARSALSLPHIEPTPPGDPQPNPADDPQGVRLIVRKYSPEGEIKAVADSLARWLPKHPHDTVAVLVPRNERGFKMVDALRQRGIKYVELLQSTRSTRETAQALGDIINCLADPTSAAKLATAYRAWQRQDDPDEEARRRLEGVATALGKCQRPEDYLWPGADRDWLAGTVSGLDSPDVGLQLAEFRGLVRRWQGTTLLPIDQLILTVAQDLFAEPADLAVAHKLALVLRRASEMHPDWRLPELHQELANIAQNERRFLGFSQDDTGFDPNRHRGEVVVATIHKAKGLEWDRVYLMSVSNYDFPSALSYDEYIAEKWFVRDNLNLVAETLTQLDALLPDSPGAQYVEGEATQMARLEYASERLRLLYVGITRAKKELVITWNSGKGKQPRQQAVPLIALRTFREEQTDDPSS